jgi:hypothetical protein
MANEHDFFQPDPGEIGSNWKGGSQARQMRAPNAVISNFNALNFGVANSDDYTKTKSIFSCEQNTAPVVGVGYGTDFGYYDYNPYVIGSTVQRMLDDKLSKMGFGDIDLFNKGFSDEKEADADGMISGKNYPSEGWRSFGGKYDFHEEYNGLVR